MDIARLKESLKEAALQEDQLKQSKQTLENEIFDLKLDLSDVKERYNCRRRSDDDLSYCITAISRCCKNMEKMIDFITNAAQGRFLDPSLLFSSDIDQIGNILYILLPQLIYS